MVRAVNATTMPPLPPPPPPGGGPGGISGMKSGFIGPSSCCPTANTPVTLYLYVFDDNNEPTPCQANSLPQPTTLTYIANQQWEGSYTPKQQPGTNTSYRLTCEGFVISLDKNGVPQEATFPWWRLDIWATDPKDPRKTVAACTNYFGDVPSPLGGTTAFGAAACNPISLLNTQCSMPPNVFCSGSPSPGVPYTIMVKQQR